MNIKFFDAHAHIQFPQFDADRDKVIERMNEKKVAALVVGTDLATSIAAVELAEKHDFLWASVGLHPTDVMDETFDEKTFSSLLNNFKVVSVGECGLDYFRVDATDEIKRKQEEVFRKHIELAIAHDKALMIHSRPSRGTNDSYEHIIEILSEYKKSAKEVLRGNIHFFVGTEDIAKRFFELGFSISFTGVITFSSDYEKVVKSTPAQNILSETDCPFVAPAGHRGERNEPVYVEEVVKKLEVLHDDEAALGETLIRNAEKMFKIKLISSDASY